MTDSKGERRPKRRRFVLDTGADHGLASLSMNATSSGRPENPAIYPSPEIMKNLEFLKDPGDNTRLYDEIWTQIRSK